MPLTKFNYSNDLITAAEGYLLRCFEGNALSESINGGLVVSAMVIVNGITYYQSETEVADAPAN